MPTHSEKLQLDGVEGDHTKDNEHVKKLVKPLVGTEGKEKQIYKCTECDYQGFRKKRLSEHMGRVHGLLPNGAMPENPMFSCDECEKTFVFEKDLSRHKKIVHHGQVFVCLVCNKNYKSKYVYDRHTATHVEGYVQPKFKCQICEQEFTTKFSLSSHIKSKHLGVKKTYSCPTCGKTFSQIRSYRQHANVHAGIRPYTCEVCGKSFTYDKSLKEHRYMHDTVRRFQCSVCQKAFRQQTCLLIHMKTHKEKKDHICSVCGREFTQKQSLLRHERIHTGNHSYFSLLYVDIVVFPNRLQICNNVVNVRLTRVDLMLSCLPFYGEFRNFSGVFLKAKGISPHNFHHVNFNLFIVYH